MLDLMALGKEIAAHRRARGMTQPELARLARIGRSTLAALETGATAELGFRKIMSLLAVLGLDLRLTPANEGRPTLEDLQKGASS